MSKSILPFFKLFRLSILYSVLFALIQLGTATSFAATCDVNGTEGMWVEVGSFQGPARHYYPGPHPYYLPPLGTWGYSIPVNYTTYDHGYGTQYIGKYCLQLSGIGPTVQVAFPAATGNSYPYVWLSCYSTYTDHRNDTVIDPVVGIFSIPVVGGYNDRGPHATACPNGGPLVAWQLFDNNFVVWEWICNTCAQEYNDLKEKCGGAINIASFDNDSCSGWCKNPELNLGPPMCIK